MYTIFAILTYRSVQTTGFETVPRVDDARTLAPRCHAPGLHDHKEQPRLFEVRIDSKETVTGISNPSCDVEDSSPDGLLA